MTGYYGKEHEKETKSALRGSWLYTGDYAALEGDGEELKLEFIGRREDILMIDGEPSSLGRMDAVLRKIPGLQDAAGFVVKNSKNHSVPLAVLVKNQASPLSEHQVVTFCKENMEDAICPQAVIFTEAIPRDIGGNVNHHKLRAQYAHLAG
jgi:acyl-CoA synthetase (AMP-forming)/AMP-acid ligase II